MILALLLACRPGGTEPDTADTGDAWADWPAQELEVGRLLLTAALDGAQAPSELVLMHHHPMAFVRDGDRVLVLDGRYGHDADAHCLPQAKWPTLSVDDAWRGDCSGTEVSLQRGVIPVPAAAMAVDEDAQVLWLVARDGRTWTVPLEPVGTHPWAFGRAVAGETVQGPVVSAQVVDGVLHTHAGLAAGSVVQVEAGLELDGVSVFEGQVLGLATDGASTWAATDDGLLHVETGETWDVAATGPLDVAGDTVLAATETGFVVLQGGVLTPWDVPVVDVDVHPWGEWVLLTTDGVQVRMDEVQQAQGPALGLYLLSFLEKPKSPQEDAPCTGSPSVTEFSANAAANADWWGDMPGTKAIGITPHLGRKSRSCGVAEGFEGIWDRRDVSVGVLFHEQAGCGGDTDCYDAHLLAQMDSVTGLGAEPDWVSGLSPNTEQGDDWVAGLARAGLPTTVLFYGMSVLPDVSHFDDPRGKESWPWATQDLARPITAATAWELDAAGPVTLHPGDSRAAFSQGGCANLFLRECQILGLGDGTVLDAGDVVLLDLSLHRALGNAPQGGSWSFHLPDLGSWDYGAGCDDDWQGCQAGLLRDWWIDVHARWVQNGAADWVSPADL
jgi:hypothetical protein